MADCRVFAAGLLLAAAGLDIRSRRVPNLVSILLLATGLVADWLRPDGPSPAAGLLAATIVLVVGFGLFQTGMLGGADVKLMVGTAAWLGLPRLGTLLLGTALAGGVVSLATLAFAGLCRRSASAPGKSIEVPYAVAIAIGGIGALYFKPFE
ncbi:MAG: prepilin peptidase [Azospirillaceae bacterium]|nr:prepilin peptidase [Azospirillaceae bacterium]